MPKTLKEIAEFINGELIGDGEIAINKIKSLEEAAGGDLSAEDREFVTREEAAMTQDQRDRWQFEREYGNG